MSTAGSPHADSKPIPEEAHPAEPSPAEPSPAGPSPEELPVWITDRLGLPTRIVARWPDQDSGCVAIGGVWGTRRLFVKWATTAGARLSLERAHALHAAVRHTAVVPLEQTIRTGDDLALVYPLRPGEVLYPADAGPLRHDRSRVDSAHARFRALPLAEVLSAIDAILDAHLALAAAGWISCDLYDGCFLYDFAARSMQLVDLDEYHPGPFVVAGERLPGSRRFMAPEEFVSGSTIDERTTVFHLARTARILLDPGDHTGAWRASRRCLDVARRGHADDPTARFPDVASFVAAWRDAARRSS